MGSLTEMVVEGDRRVAVVFMIFIFTFSLSLCSFMSFTRLSFPVVDTDESNDSNSLSY